MHRAVSVLQAAKSKWALAGKGQQETYQLLNMDQDFPHMKTSEVSYKHLIQMSSVFQWVVQKTLQSDAQ